MTRLSHERVDFGSSCRLSLTYDQGKAMSQHQTLAAALGLKVFFCPPHSPSERGTCESQNGRIRAYLPKGTDLHSVLSSMHASFNPSSHACS